MITDNYLSVYLSVCLSVHLSVCLSVSDMKKVKDNANCPALAAQTESVQGDLPKHLEIPVFQIHCNLLSNQENT